MPDANHHQTPSTAMSVSTSEVPFVRPTTAATPLAAAPGFEALAPGPAPTAPPSPAGPPSTPQLLRATDLFLRGALTPERYAEAKASRGGFELVIGRSNLLPAVFLEIGVATSRATCLIRTSGVDFLGRSGSWSGTGFLLSPNLLLTNHHVLNSPEVAAAGTCVFDYQIGRDGQPMPTHAFRLRPDRLFLTSPARGGMDFTFVWVDGEPGRQFGAVRVDRKAFAIAEGEFANVISHPGGGLKTVALQENEVIWQDALVLHYTSDTEPGSSGASVCNNNWQLVALHHASRASAASANQVLNEGIKLSAIANYLEQRAQSGEADAATAQEILSLFRGSDERLGFFGLLGRGGAEQPALEAVVNSYRGSEQDLDVGFWNVEWFTKHYETKAAAVARVVHEMNLDVWTLEESSPNAAEALVKILKDDYGLNYDYLAAEPGAPDGKQSCTLIWNQDTVSGQREAWGEPVETWLNAHSRDFDDLGFEAVQGKIFDRYPALFHFTTTKAANGKPFDCYVVPLHLKAMGEGSLRRQMASKILAAAIRKRIEQGADGDWILGGDYNAEIATGDFAALVGGGLTPVSAGDEQGGAFSYLKGPRSLIDHIFLSPNLARTYGPSDYFVVAAEKTFPDYLRDISDHRPVLVRLSLQEASAVAGGSAATGDSPRPASPALDELRQLITLEPPVQAAAAAAAAAQGLEQRRPPRPASASGAKQGYDQSFLGAGELQVPLPELPETLARDAVTVKNHASGLNRFVLPYTHFSVVMNGGRRLPFYSGVNIDGRQLRRIPRTGDKWNFDPRIDRELQAGDEIYKNNDLDRGHMTRRLDPVWGSFEVANRADADTFCFTNACPQHKDLNQKEWSDLEDYVLENADVHDLKASVITGPVFGPNDKPYRGICLPEEFWKVVVIVRKDTRKLSATAYLLSQRDMLTGFEFVFGAFRTYQITLREVEQKTGLDLGRLRDFDPLSGAQPVPGGFEAVTGTGLAKLITGPADLVL